MKRKTETNGQKGDRTRERILSAALEVFAEHGFDGARTRDIAERAGANLGLIKYYFNDKERLWKAAVSRAFGELQTGLAEVGERNSGSEMEWLERVVRHFIRFVARHPEFMRLMNDEAKRDNKRMRWLADRFVRPMTDAIGSQLERAQKRGVVAPISTVSMRYIVLGAAGLVFSQAPECKYISGIDPTEPGFADQHADAVIRLLTGNGISASLSRARNRAGSKRSATRVRGSAAKG